MERSGGLKNLICVFGLAALITARTIPEAHTKRGSPPWPYGVIGDSWGSGVAYINDVLYDNNTNNCLRTKESHGPQLEADTSWTGSFSSGLRDAACSGSRLVDIVLGGNQMGKVGQPNLVVMTSGGNNCGFGDIVEKCIYHASPFKNYGKAYADDTDRTGDCAKALDGALTQITNTLPTDLTNTLDDIFNLPDVKSNPDFLLYLTGYAQFFGTDYDPWCNTEAWNIAGISATPYLSKELRTTFNDHVSKVNELYKNTIQQKYSKQARYIDLDAGFQGHRFCEAGMSHSDQLNNNTNFDKVYLWNLNWPWDVQNTAAPNPDEQSGNVSSQEAQQLFGNNGVTAWSSESGGVNDGWRLRPFHPRYSGYTTIKNAIIAQMKADGLPKAESSGTPAGNPPPSNSPGPEAPPPPPAYAPGTCSFHLDEYQDCEDMAHNLYANITLFDNDKALIGNTNIDNTKNPIGDPINTSDSLHFKSKLPYDLVVTGEHDNDYVQFNYNGLQFTSRDSRCSNGGWDPREGPVCGLPGLTQNAVSHYFRAIDLKSTRKADAMYRTGKPNRLFFPVLGWGQGVG